MLFIFFILTMLTSPQTFSSSLDYNSLYLNPTSTKSEVIIFYDPLIPCERCHQTIDDIISILKQNFQNKINAYLININEHPSFIYHFNLKGPINLVTIKINDHAAFGYHKLTNPQSEIYDPISFKNQITEFINNSLYLN
jgi:hypothetical protein